MTRARRALPVLRIVAFPAALAIVAVMGVIAFRDVPIGDMDPRLLAAAVVPALVWWLLLARGWALLVSGAWTPHDTRTWFRTQTLRYLPGGIWAPASRLTVVEGGALDRLSTVTAENVLALGAALAVGGLLLGLSGEVTWLPLLLAAPVPAWLARRAAGRVSLDPARVARATPNFLLAFAAYVTAAALVQGAVSGGHDLPAVAGAAGIAWAAGLVVVVAPGGIGVRELAFVGILGPMFPNAELAAGAVTLRLVTIVAEALALLALGRGTDRPTTKSPRSRHTGRA